jgi:elongation factor Ts
MPMSAQDVKRLREKTGLGMMDCKKALEEASGDEAKAIEILRKKGLKMAEAKLSRAATEGVIASYVHTNSRVAAMVEVACETDFVARNAEFVRLAHDLCMQVVAARPLAVSPEELPAELIEREKGIYREQVAGKPAHIVDRIVEGKLQAFYQQVCLLKQPFIRDESGKETVGDVVKAAIAKLGENIVVRRFCRFELGETAEKESGASASGGET